MDKNKYNVDNNTPLDTALTSGAVATAGLGAGAGSLSLQELLKLNKPVAETKLLGEVARPVPMPNGRILIHFPYAPKFGTGEHASAVNIVKGLRKSGVTNPIDFLNDVDLVTFVPGSILKRNMDTIPYSGGARGANIINRDFFKRHKKDYIAELGTGADEGYLGDYALHKNEYKGAYGEGTEHVVNLGKVTDLHSNYGTGATKGSILPFTNPAPDMDRRAIRSLIKKGTGKDVPEAKKIVTMSGGGTGFALDDTAPEIFNALKNRKDVHYVIMKGSGANTKMDFVAEAARHGINPEDVTVVGRVPNDMFQTILGSSDLNVGYTGANSLTEQVTAQNPSVLAVDHTSTVKTTASQRKNMRDLEEWASKQYGIPLVMKGEGKRNTKLLNGMLDNSEEITAASAKRAEEARNLLRGSGERFVNAIKRAETHVPTFSTIGLTKLDPWKDMRFKGVRQLAEGGALGFGLSGLLMALKAYNKNDGRLLKTSETKESHKSDLMKILGTIAFGGLGAYGGYSAIKAFPALDMKNKLSELANYLEKNNKIIREDPKAILDAHDRYAKLAQGLDKTPIFHTNIRGISEKYPLSWVNKRLMVDDLDKAKSFLKEIMTNKRSLTPEEWHDFSQIREHYRAIAQNPQRALASEVLTNRAHGRFQDLRPELRKVVDRAMFDKIINNGGSMTERFEGLEDLLKPALQQRYDELLMPTINGKKSAHHLRSYAGATGGIVPPVAIAGATAAGVGGTGVYELNKDSEELKISPVKTEEKVPSLRTSSSKLDGADNAAYILGGGAAASTLGGYLTLRSRDAYRKPAEGEVIGVSAGHLTRPSWFVDTGAGHVTPGKAIVESLKAHPKIQDGTIKVDDLVKVYSEPGKFDIKATTPKYKHHTVHVNSGFGVNFTPNKLAKHNVGLTTNPLGSVTHLPDTVPSEIGDTKFAIYNGYLGQFEKDKKFTSFGPNAKKSFTKDLSHVPAETSSVGNENIFHSEHNPAILDQTLESSTKRINEGIDKHKVLRETAEDLMAGGDAKGSQLIQDALKKNKKIVTISGSSRGDIVALRAKELDNLLKAKGRDDVLVLAELGSGADAPSAALLNNTDNVVKLGFLDSSKPRTASRFVDLQGVADFHVGSTGAMSYAESMMTPTPVGFVTNYSDTKKRESALLDSEYVKELGSKLKQGLISNADYSKAKQDLDAYKKEAGLVNLDAWNKETMKHISDQAAYKKGAVFTANTPDEILDNLDFITKHGDEIKGAARNRAVKTLEATKQAKRGLADALVDQVFNTRQMSDELINSKTLKGKGLLALAGVLGVGGVVALIHKLKKEKNMNKKSAEDLGMSPLQAILQQGAPKMMDRPGDPSLAAPVEAGAEASESPDTRKLTIADKGMDGNEIKMSVESSKENDARINFLLNAFTQKTQDNEDSGVDAQETGAPSEPAEEAEVLPVQGIPVS